MHRLAERIERVTNTFTDPAQVYAFGVRNVMKAATTDQRWRWLLMRSEVIAGAMYRVMGPYAIRDIKQACKAGRYSVEDPELAWRQATHAIVGFQHRGVRSKYRSGEDRRSRCQLARNGRRYPRRSLGDRKKAVSRTS